MAGIQASAVKLTIPADSLRKLPDSAVYRGKSGQANLTVRNHDDCPVLGGLRKQQEEHDGGEDTDGIGKRRQCEQKPTGGTGDGGDTGECGAADDTGGQPP